MRSWWAAEHELTLLFEGPGFTFWSEISQQFCSWRGTKKAFPAQNRRFCLRVPFDLVRRESTASHRDGAPRPAFAPILRCFCGCLLGFDGYDAVSLVTQRLPLRSPWPTDVKLLGRSPADEHMTKSAENNIWGRAPSWQLMWMRSFVWLRKRERSPKFRFLWY